jgi:hypothetical protein
LSMSKSLHYKLLKKMEVVSAFVRILMDL